MYFPPRLITLRPYANVDFEEAMDVSVDYRKSPAFKKSKKEREKKKNPGERQSYFIYVYICFSMNLSFNPFLKPKQARGKFPVASTD